jgi:PEP-CTERM motif
MFPTHTHLHVTAPNQAAVRAVRGALWFAFALGSAGAEATTLNTAQLSVAPDFAGGSGPYDGLENQNGPASLAGTATGGANSSGAGTAFVNWGVVKLTGSALGSLDTVARGIFRDELVITAPGIPNGTVGTVTYALDVSGSLFADAPGVARASWSLAADLGGGVFDINVGGTQNSPINGGGYVGAPFGTFFGTAQFAFGSIIQLYVQFDGVAQAAYTSTLPGLPNASFDLGQSLYWGGFSGIAVNGAPVSGFNVTSTSGTNYRDSMAPVPEPGALAMVLAGLGVLVGLQRHRR